jgi:hypothetical protein
MPRGSKWQDHRIIQVYWEVTMFAHRQLHLKLVAFLVIILSISCSGLSSAQGFSDFCAQAQSLLDQNEPLKAMAVIRKAMGEAWARTPFQVEKAVLVKEKAVGYGAYVPRMDNAYKSGEIIYLYLEPIGFTQQEKDGHYFIALAADFTVRKDDGTIVGGKENFGRWELKYKSFITEFNMNMDYTFRMQPGNYVIKTVLKDLASLKTIAVETPVRIE